LSLMMIGVSLFPQEGVLYCFNSILEHRTIMIHQVP
jgi:hypothetical protein